MVYLAFYSWCSTILLSSLNRSPLPIKKLRNHRICAYIQSKRIPTIDTTEKEPNIGAPSAPVPKQYRPEETLASVSFRVSQ